MKGSIRPVEVGEVSKAVFGLALGKAPGPDGLQADDFKRLQCLWPVLAQLFTLIIRTGSFPKRLLDIYITP